MAPFSSLLLIDHRADFTLCIEAGSSLRSRRHIRTSMKTVIVDVGGPGFTAPKAAVCEESCQNHASMDDRAFRLKPCDNEREARDEHGDREG